ncbi:methylated-DNA--[protein]-cysteine S-methyltransferase [Nakamurella sp. GG22]
MSSAVEVGVRHAVVDSPVGELTLVGRAGALSGVYFPEHVRRPEQEAFGDRDDTAFAEARRQLAEYFVGSRRTFDLELAPVGNAFQRRVWAQLTAIPYGETRTYGQLAVALGDRGLARAVGAANGQNPLSIVVPCHRVVGADGKLTGYAGGVQRKAFLLDLETPFDRRPAALF